MIEKKINENYSPDVYRMKRYGFLACFSKGYKKYPQMVFILLWES
jgi:hypothetical protein